MNLFVLCKRCQEILCSFISWHGYLFGSFGCRPYNSICPLYEMVCYLRSVKYNLGKKNTYFLIGVFLANWLIN